MRKSFFKFKRLLLSSVSLGFPLHLKLKFQVAISTGISGAIYHPTKLKRIKGIFGGGVVFVVMKSLFKFSPCCLCVSLSKVNFSFN